MQPAEVAASELEATFHLPNTLKTWPWQFVLNPHYDEIMVEHGAWWRTFMPALAELGLVTVATTYHGGTCVFSDSPSAHPADPNTLVYLAAGGFPKASKGSLHHQMIWEGYGLALRKQR